MKRSKTFILALVVLLPFMFGCASGGIKKPTVFADKLNNIPADTPSQFDSRYERFISDKEMEAFHKLQTDEERQAFQDKFWNERDPDPSTPENELKNEIDDRIDDIANERFFNASGTTGLLFRSNGGFRGDMAKVYLLHGEPDAMDILEATGGNSFVPLMLWVYLNHSNGNILYAFLFYQRGGGGSFSLFPQDAYKLDPCSAVNEVMAYRDYKNFGGLNQACPPDVEQVVWYLQNANGKSGTLDGRIFFWALFNFSQDGSILQGKVLEPPKAASETAKQSKARVTGEAPKLTGTAGTDYILASCEKCNSMITAELSMGERFTISGPWQNFDWTVKGEYLELSIKYRIILESRNGRKPIVLEDVAVMDVKKSSLDEHPEIIVIVDLVKPEQVATIPSGTYQASIYVKNTITNKSNAWSKEFTK